MKIDVADLMNYVLSYLTKYRRLPTFKIYHTPEAEDNLGEESIISRCDEDDGTINQRGFRFITPSTLTGLKKITQLLAVAALIANLQAEGTTMMLRDVYYTLKHIFDSQDDCNEIILLLGKLLGRKRYEMNLVPSSKGLFSGVLKFSFQDTTMQDNNSDQTDTGSWIFADENTAPEGLLIDSRWVSASESALQIEFISHQRPVAILMVEKEAIFYRLLQGGVTSMIPCILVTSCGYPDLSTKAMIARLSRKFPDIPVVGLCDYNPHGLALLLSFQYYSSTIASFEAAGLTAPINWLGLRSHHVRNMLQCDPDTAVSLQPLSLRDNALITSLLNRPFMQDLQNYVDELQVMAAGGVKCEIEVLYMLGLHMLVDFVCTAIKEGDYI